MALDDADKLELLNQRVRGWADAALSNWAALGDWVEILARPVIPEGSKGAARELVRGMGHGPVLSRRASLDAYRQRFLKPADLKRRDPSGACIGDVLHSLDIVQGIETAFPTVESVWDTDNLDRLLHGQAISMEDRRLLAGHGLAAVDDTGLPRTAIHTPGTANPLADQPERRPTRTDFTSTCGTSEDEETGDATGTYDTTDTDEGPIPEPEQEDDDGRNATIQALLTALRDDPTILDDMLNLVDPAGT